MLNGAGNAQGHVDLGVNGLTGLTNLVVHTDVAVVHHGTGSANHAAQNVGQLLSDLQTTLGVGADTTAHGDNHVGAKKAVVVTPEVNQNVVLSARNIPGVVTTTAKVLSVYDIVNAGKFIVDKAALAVIEEVFA